MGQKRRKIEREKGLTSRYREGGFDEDNVESQQRFSRRSVGAEQRKIAQTALLRAAEAAAGPGIECLPAGEVIQVYSLFYQVLASGGERLCVLRKTLSKLLDSPIVVGDLVRFRDTGIVDERGQPEAVIEEVLPRRTLLTRAESFKGTDAQPIVANADQMLIVVSLLKPEVRWGLVDRMIVAAQAGGLHPVVCLNKVDLGDGSELGRRELAFAVEAMGHYGSVGITTVQTSVTAAVGLDALRDILRDKTTVVAGHSGVGKSSLINSIEPTLRIRVGAISGYTGKGRHTTTSARRYELSFGGRVVDTPGVKLFGLWGVTPDNLLGYFPDVQEETAPEWRQESYARILESIEVR